MERMNALLKVITKVTESEQKKECHVYSTAFLRLARVAADENDFKAEELCVLLGRIAFPHLKSELAVTPFSPMPSGPLDVESSVPASVIISNDHLELLGAALSRIADVELRARVADILWVIKRKVEFAEVAIDAYLDSAKRLENPEHWTQCQTRIERALRLALLLGRKTGRLDTVVAHIEGLLSKYGGNDPLFLSQRLMAHLLEVNQGEPDKYAALSERIAECAESASNYYRARAYWETTAEWQKRRGDKKSRHRALVRAAETFVKEAEAAVYQPNQGYIAACSHLQSAIVAYRRLGGEKVRVEKLHAQLIHFQKESIKEIRPTVTKLDLSDIASSSIERVSGKLLIDALMELAVMVPNSHPDKLKKGAKEQAEKFPLQHLFDGVIVNEKGKVVGKRATMLSDGPEAAEALRQSMNELLDYDRFIYTQGVIEPARYQILLEHNIQLTDLLPFLSNNPFVPRGHELIFAKGLLAGLEGDYCVSLHLLIPQIENSIRHILARAGVLTSGIDDNGIQDERSLNVTLYMEELEKMFGRALAFDLQSLLVERSGANLRNRMAHGLMSHGSFYSIHAPYLWCLVIRLCFAPVIRAKYVAKEEGDDVAERNECEGEEDVKDETEMAELQESED